MQAICIITTMRQVSDLAFRAYMAGICINEPVNGRRSPGTA